MLLINQHCPTCSSFSRILSKHVSSQRFSPFSVSVGGKKGASSDGFDHFPSIGSAARFGTLKEVHAELGTCSQEPRPGAKTGARFGCK